MKKIDRSKPLALIVDDERSICDSLAGVLSDEGWESVSAYSGTEGIKKFREYYPDLVLLDIWMTGIDGIETLQRLKALRATIPVVIMSGHGTIETAVKATKLGAFEFLEKPLSIDKLLPMLNHALEMKRLAGQVPSEKPLTHEKMIGESAPIVNIRQIIEKVAPRNAWVLITGENGTGKEVAARQVHVHSSRADKPFIAINCAAIPENLIESELFGHEKGAFTNALTQKKGKFELANHGTLFLDEIGDMSLKTQAKVLRILQEQQFERLGGSATISVDVRVIAATNKDLKAMMQTGDFREDLYYRLNVIQFELPALRERGKDIILLAQHFLQSFAKGLDEPPRKLDDDLQAALVAYPWPGNVRELMNVVERMNIMASSDVLRLSDLPDYVRDAEGGEHIATGFYNASSTLKEAKSEFEKNFILDKLVENSWNVSKTAEAIGIERSNLHRKLKTYEIDPKKSKG